MRCAMQAPLLGGLGACLRLPPVGFWGALHLVVGRAGSTKWAHRSVKGVLGEKWGWSKIAQKIIKRCGGGVSRPKLVCFIIFLESMDPGLSFKVYYSPRDPFPAKCKFF